MKHPLSLMVWGAMSGKGTTGLFFLPRHTTVNGSSNLELLKEMLEISMNVHQRDTFMHDGVPCHRSKLVGLFLERMTAKVLDWPGNSPDLNPMKIL